jgi:cell volume regulation protein A
MNEPLATATIVLIAGGLMAASVLLSRAALRIGVPAVVLFLFLGMLGGVDGLGKVPFDDHRLAFQLGSIALVLILFDGGLNTPISVIRRVAAPAGLLATVGVGITAVVMAGCAYALGLPFGEALLVGAVTSSTDAAAVFSVLRGSGIRLAERVAGTLELESGLNDPLAVLLTTAATTSLASGVPLSVALLPQLVLQLAIGLAVGVTLGRVGQLVLVALKPTTGGLYPVFTVALALLSFGGATMLFGSGFLSVYATGVMLGRGKLPYRSVVVRVHDFLAWCGQIVMFGVLGLLVFPSRVLGVAPLGIALALGLAVIARPVAVAVCLAPFRFSGREIGLIGWLGLRGSVPIVLATIPVIAALPAGERLFDLVFFVVVVSALVQGGTARFVASRLGLSQEAPKAPEAVVELASVRPLSSGILAFVVAEPSIVAHVAIRDIPLPDASAITLVVRGETLLAPRGQTVLRPGDCVYVFCPDADRPYVELLFGRGQEA